MCLLMHTHDVWVNKQILNSCQSQLCFMSPIPCSVKKKMANRFRFYMSLLIYLLFIYLFKGGMIFITSQRTTQLPIPSGPDPPESGGDIITFYMSLVIPRFSLPKFLSDFKRRYLVDVSTSWIFISFSTSNTFNT